MQTIMWFDLAALMPVAIGAAILGSRVHARRHARGTCDCGQGE